MAGKCSSYCAVRVAKLLMLDRFVSSTRCESTMSSEVDNENALREVAVTRSRELYRS